MLYTDISAISIVVTPGCIAKWAPYCPGQASSPICTVTLIETGRDGKNSFEQAVACRYAVACGRIPGVYESWHDCQDQVKGYSGARFKSFTSKQEAQTFCGERGAQVKRHGVSVVANSFKNTPLKSTSGVLLSTPATARVVSARSDHGYHTQETHVSVVCLRFSVLYSSCCMLPGHFTHLCVCCAVL